MVTSGSARQSSRGGARRAGRAASASVERGRRKHMRDVMRGERDQAQRPLRFDRADRLDDARGRRAEAALAQRLERDESPSPASPAMPAGTKISRPTARFSTGSARPEPSVERAIDGETRAFSLSRILTTRPE